MFLKASCFAVGIVVSTAIVLWLLSSFAVAEKQPVVAESAPQQPLTKRSMLLRSSTKTSLDLSTTMTSVVSVGYY